MAECGFEVDHSSVRWVIKLVPLFEKAFRKRKALSAGDGGWMRPTVRPTSVARLHGVKLLEHVWNAVPGNVDVVVPAWPSSAARGSEPKRR